MLGSTLRRSAAVLLASALLFAAGWMGRGWYRDDEVSRRVRLGGYRFISPLLDVELPEGYGVGHEPIPFKHEVRALVEEQVAAGAVSDMAVYYRDLLDGPWFGINEQATYNPASLMKVPVMIAWLKRAERDPRELRRRLVFDAQAYPGQPQATPPARTLEAGASYTVDELLQLMLRFSDNRSMWLLYRELDERELGDVLDGMDVTNDPSGAENHVSAHGYSGFLRVLYNAAYLGREMSEKALELMSHQDFPQGIVAGVPAGVMVASKFGEDVSPGRVELHEFGIVYHRRGPYILGVMTRGQDLARQAGVIRKVSALVYQQVEEGGTLAPPR